MSTPSDNVSIALPKGSVESIVNAHIRAAVGEVLAKDPAGLVREVVDQAMRQKRDHYTGKCIFEEKVNDMIREVAADEFKKWLDEMRPAIAKQIRAKFDGSGKKLVDEIAGKLTGQLSGMFDVRIDIRGPR